MTDEHTFMVFGAIVAMAGFFLAATARAGTGKTTIDVFGAQITLAAAGGIIVILMGLLTFALPTAIALRYKPVIREVITRLPDKDEASPKDTKAAEKLLSAGPASPQQVAAYLEAYSGDIMRYVSLDYGGSTLVSAESNKRSANIWFTFYRKVPDSAKDMAFHHITQQLCLTTGLRRALELGGSVRIEISDQPAVDVINMYNHQYLDCS